MSRKIIHCDADCFFAAIEQRDNPRLRDQPLAVGGSSAGRGVIATCNYEARRYGVRSAMPSAHALRLCPELKIVPHRMDVYRQASAQMHDIFSQYTNLVEPLSLDEAYLDVSQSYQCLGSASLMAEEIRWRVKNQIGITVSAGVAPNKFLAKVASDWRKPDGQTLIKPKDIPDFMRLLDVEKIPGVGQVMRRKLQGLGINTCGDLQSIDLLTLCERFGSFGERLYHLCRGVDERLVKPERQRKSVSIEQTFSYDLVDLAACIGQMTVLMPKLQQRLQQVAERGLAIDKAFVKIKFDDFSVTTVERKGTQPRIAVYRALCEEAFARGRRPVRLIGLGVGLKDGSVTLERQLELFPSSN